MSSLKGQLANVEGSVKSMKMAVVVGSVLTVACLAAVFGVTILANEVSKETKVSNGALVNRQGKSVGTATKVYANFAKNLQAGSVHVGEVVIAPVSEEGVVVKGAHVECMIEKVQIMPNMHVAYCDDVAFIAMQGEEHDGHVYIAYDDENNMFSKVAPGTPVPTDERNLQNPMNIICFACSIAVEALDGDLVGAIHAAIQGGAINVLVKLLATEMIEAMGKAFGVISCAMCMMELIEIVSNAGIARGEEDGPVETDLWGAGPESLSSVYDQATLW